MAKSDTKFSGFSIKSVITLLAFTLTTPNGRGSSTFCTQIIPSLLLSNTKSALNKVSANTTNTFPSKLSLAHIIACAVPKALCW